MNDSEIRDYLSNIAERLEFVANFLHLSGEIALNASVNNPVKLKSMVDTVVYGELMAMSSMIIDDIKEDE